MASHIEQAIIAAMARWSKSRMVWGTDDCMIAVADLVRECTGKDPARRFRGRYKTRRGAFKTLGPGGTLAAAKVSARALHWRSIEPDKARPGDVGLAPLTVAGRPVHVAMICRASGWFVGRAETGFAALPASKLSHAWRVA